MLKGKKKETVKTIFQLCTCRCFTFYYTPLSLIISLMYMVQFMLAHLLWSIDQQLLRRTESGYWAKHKDLCTGDVSRACSNQPACPPQREPWLRLPSCSSTTCFWVQLVTQDNNMYQCTRTNTCKDRSNTHTISAKKHRKAQRHNHRHTGTYTHSYTTHSFIPIDLHISTKRGREKDLGRTSRDLQQ